MRFDGAAILHDPFRDIIPLAAWRAAPDDGQGARLQIRENCH
jgi:hypothetical protein